MSAEASAVLLQYGALGAIALVSIMGTAWLVRGMRNDVHSMIQANAKSNKQFTDYLIEQTRTEAQKANQAFETNRAFVTAINALTARIDKYIDPRGVNRAPDTQNE